MAKAWDEFMTALVFSEMRFSLSNLYFRERRASEGESSKGQRVSQALQFEQRNTFSDSEVIISSGVPYFLKKGHASLHVPQEVHFSKKLSAAFPMDTVICFSINNNLFFNWRVY